VRAERPVNTERAEGRPERAENRLISPQSTEPVILAAIEVHKHLGPGLREAVYEDCMAYELSLRGIPFERQKTFKVEYKNKLFRRAFRPDLVVRNNLIVEVKAVAELADIHIAQVVNYLKLSGCKFGLLINFNVKSIGQGLKRVMRPL
jgi:GxxExxY protein